MVMGRGRGFKADRDPALLGYCSVGDESIVFMYVTA